MVEALSICCTARRQPDLCNACGAAQAQGAMVQPSWSWSVQKHFAKVRVTKCVCACCWRNRVQCALCTRSLFLLHRGVECCCLVSRQEGTIGSISPPPPNAAHQRPRLLRRSDCFAHAHRVRERSGVAAQRRRLSGECERSPGAKTLARVTACKRVFVRHGE